MWMSVSMHTGSSCTNDTDLRSSQQFQDTHDFWTVEKSEDLHSSNVTAMAQKCLTLEDVKELNSSLSQLRAELCMNVLEHSKWRYYKKYFAQVKKYDERKYNVGDEVYLKKPDQYGLVTFANFVGVVKQCLPCEYYTQK